MNHLPTGQGAVNRDQRDRIRALERDRPTNPRPATSERAPFSHAGAVSAAGDEPEWDVEVGGQITAAANSGGGGGGSGNSVGNNNSGAGGFGIVIVRYLT